MLHKLLSFLINEKRKHKTEKLEFPLWLSRFRTQCSGREDACSFPGLPESVKDLALPQAAVKVTDEEQIWHCCVCGVGLSCNSSSTPVPGTWICHRCGCKNQRKQTKNREASKKKRAPAAQQVFAIISVYILPYVIFIYFFRYKTLKRNENY